MEKEETKTKVKRILLRTGAIMNQVSTLVLKAMVVSKINVRKIMETQCMDIIRISFHKIILGR